MRKDKLQVIVAVSAIQYWGVIELQQSSMFTAQTQMPFSGAFICSHFGYV